MSAQNEYHAVVHDRVQVERFAEMFTPIGEDDVLLLFASFRRKYLHSNAETAHLVQTPCISRTAITGVTPSKFYREVSRFQVPVCCYVDRNENPYPNGTMTVYCPLNPRSSVMAYEHLTGYFTSLFVKSSIKPEENQSVKNIVSVVKSGLQKAIPKSLFYELDIDTKDPVLLTKIHSVIKSQTRGTDAIVCIIETKNGFHVVFKCDKFSKYVKSAYGKVFMHSEWEFEDIDSDGNYCTKRYVEIRTDAAPPVPGTFQAGFKVRFVESILPV